MRFVIKYFISGICEIFGRNFSFSVHWNVLLPLKCAIRTIAILAEWNMSFSENYYTSILRRLKCAIFGRLKCAIFKRSKCVIFGRPKCIIFGRSKYLVFGWLKCNFRNSAFRIAIYSAFRILFWKLFYSILKTTLKTILKDHLRTILFIIISIIFYYCYYYFINCVGEERGQTRLPFGFLFVSFFL